MPEVVDASEPVSTQRVEEAARGALFALVAGIRGADPSGGGVVATSDVRSADLIGVVLRGFLSLYVAQHPSDGSTSAWVDAAQQLARRERASGQGALQQLIQTWFEAEDDHLIDGDAKQRLLRLHIDDAAVDAALNSLDLDYTKLSPFDFGAVYEALIGLRVSIVERPSVCLGARGNMVSLADLLARPAEDRVRWLARNGDIKLNGRASQRLRQADSAEALVEILARRFHQRYRRVLMPGDVVVVASADRRSAGAHFTPRPICRAVVERALAPLLREQTLESRLRVCDPAMGAGAFLLEAYGVLAEAYPSVAADANQGAAAPRSIDVPLDPISSLYGVDRDPVAVDVARLSLWLQSGGAADTLRQLDAQLVCGDALLGVSAEGLASLSKLGRPAQLRAADAMVAAFLGESGGSTGRSNLQKKKRVDAATAVERGAMPWGDGELWMRHCETVMARWQPSWGGPALHWSLQFPEVFGEGFDAIVGNPPWVAYAGRAAQPLDPALFDYFAEHFESFAAYRTLQGLFVERGVSLLKSGGRLGLVVPTSLSDLEGYRPVRLVHDRDADVDDELPDFGADAFAGVFQPAMGLLSTRRAPGAAANREGGAVWPLERSDLDSVERDLLARLSDCPPLPAECFGERGFQSVGDDVNHILPLAEAPAHAIPIREGADIAEGLCLAPRLALDTQRVKARWRSPAEWKAVSIYIRQTARYPVAAASDGLPFRNSILAGFGALDLPSDALVSYLNSTLVRWLHYCRFRDARQGMPQMKIGHLRSVPAIPPAAIETLASMGAAIRIGNRGIDAVTRQAIDDTVTQMFDLSEGEHERVKRFAERVRAGL